MGRPRGSGSPTDVDVLATSRGGPYVTLSTHPRHGPPYIPPRRDERGPTDAARATRDRGRALSAAERLRARGRRRGDVVRRREETTHDGAHAADAWARAHALFRSHAPWMASRREHARARDEGRDARSSNGGPGGALGLCASRALGDARSCIRLGARPVELPRDELLGETTVNIGSLTGGVADNVVAPSAEARLMARIVGPPTRYGLGGVRRPDARRSAQRDPGDAARRAGGVADEVGAFATILPTCPRGASRFCSGPAPSRAHRDDEHVAIADSTPLFSRTSASDLPEPIAGLVVPASFLRGSSSRDRGHRVGWNQPPAQACLGRPGRHRPSTDVVCAAGGVLLTAAPMMAGGDLGQIRRRVWRARRRDPERDSAACSLSLRRYDSATVPAAQRRWDSSRCSRGGRRALPSRDAERRDGGDPARRAGLYFVRLRMGGRRSSPSARRDSRASWIVALLAALFWTVTSLTHKIGIAEVGAMPWATALRSARRWRWPRFPPWRGRKAAACRATRRRGCADRRLCGSLRRAAVRAAQRARLSQAAYVMAVVSTSILLATMIGVLGLRERGGVAPITGRAAGDQRSGAHRGVRIDGDPRSVSGGSNGERPREACASRGRSRTSGPPDYRAP